MNATAGVEKLDPNDENSNLAAVSEVETDIRHFVKDVAFLRRPSSGPITAEPLVEPSP